MPINVNDPLIGHNLDGYLIEELLGHGGMGRVYRATDANLNRYAAIKILDVEARNPEHYEQRFSREAQSIAKLRHQNIVAVYRFKEVDNIFYMAMEFIDGADLRWVLRDYFADDELMDYDTILSVTSQIADALDYSHQHGVIHRDIKPPNIMIARDGKAYLTDFGLALDTTTGSVGEIFGSPHYIAPEQAINSASAVPQTDIYSLGVILYEMLTGSIPFVDGSIIEIAMSHIHETPPDPRKFNPDLPEIFVPILEKALAKEPKDRYQTGSELVSGLKNAVRTVEKTQPAMVFSTLSKPAERIAQNISPLRPPTAFDDIKPPTRIDNSSATRALSEGKKAKPITSETSAATVRDKPRRSGLGMVAVVLIIMLLGIGGLYYVSPEIFDDFLGQSLSNSSSRSFASIEGRVIERDDSNKILVVYDLPVQVDENHLLWLEAEVGDSVYIEGEVSEIANGLRFETLETTRLNGEAIGDAGD